MTDNDESGKEHTDKLLDAIVARIRDVPVPDYPDLSISGLKQLADVSSAVPVVPLLRRSRAATLAVAFPIAVLLIAALVVANLEFSIPRNDDTGELPFAVVHVEIIDPQPQLDAMLRELDDVSHRLDELERTVALLEVQSQAALLLADYTPNTSDNL